MKVFEYLDHRGDGVYTDWYEGRTKRQRAALDAKLDTVRAAGEAAAPPGTGELPPNMFRGPVKYEKKFYPNTYKFTVNCDAALRPLSCKGPIDPDNEWTILLPVIEVGGKYPDGVFQDAEERRKEIIADPSRRREILSDDDE